MGIKGANPEIKRKTRACFTLPYEILAGEHVTCDGNEMIYRYVNGVFKTIRYDSLSDEEKSLDSWKLIDAMLAKHWNEILGSMMAGIRRFSDSTYITFIMDGSDRTGTVNSIDAIGGRFDIRNRLARAETIFDNFEPSSEDSSDSCDLGETETPLIPVYIDSGNTLPSLDTFDMKMTTWENRNTSNERTVSRITSGDNKTLAGFFRMTAFAKILIHDLVAVMDYRKLSVIYADGEADFLIALYCNEGRSFGCITEDSDQLAYGSSLHIVKADSKGLHVRYVPIVLHDFEISQDQLTAWCILLGCDYNERINKMGPVNSMKVVKRLKKPPSQEALTLIARFMECWNIFSSACGYDYIQGDKYFVSESRMCEKIAGYMPDLFDHQSDKTE